MPILSWALSSDATLERLGARLAEVAVELRRVNEREQRVSERARRVAEEVQRIELTFAPPSEAELGAARLARDTLVARLANDSVLLRETQGAVARADELADRLRREAVRVNELAALRAEGANEAGKSTALRAVRGLLFGIPEQTGDAHRHPASEFVIEASLSTLRGESVFVRRRKKRKDSLRDRDDAPLAEDAVTRLLGGVDAAAYERLFAFDHERLAESAEEMLKGKGDVGEALFSAGAGSSKVGAVLRSLEQEAADIFTPLARTRPLNVLIKEYRTLQAELRKTRLLPDAYLAQRDSVDRAEQEAERIRLERLRFEAERSKLSRVERALPWLGRLRVARLELGEEALPTSLPSEVSERRQSSELTREQARSELRHFQAEQIRDRERLARIHEIPKIVEVPEETLLALLASSHALAKERRALPERRAELALLREDAFELARKFGLCTESERIAELTLR